MNENKDFEKLMKDYYAQMQQLIEKNRRLRQNNPNGGDTKDIDNPPTTDNAETAAANDEPQMTQSEIEEPTEPTADSFGSLAVQVTAARGAVPVENALVVISEDGEDGAERMLFTLQTNRNGETQTVRLATYPLSLSQNPDFCN